MMCVCVYSVVRGLDQERQEHLGPHSHPVQPSHEAQITSVLPFFLFRRPWRNLYQEILKERRDLSGPGATGAPRSPWACRPRSIWGLIGAFASPAAPAIDASRCVPKTVRYVPKTVRCVPKTVRCVSKTVRCVHKTVKAYLRQTNHI